MRRSVCVNAAFRNARPIRPRPLMAMVVTSGPFRRDAWRFRRRTCMHASDPRCLDHSSPIDRRQPLASMTRMTSGDDLSLRELAFVHDVVPIEHRSCLVTCQEHGDAFWHTSANQIAGGSARTNCGAGDAAPSLSGTHRAAPCATFAPERRRDETRAVHRCGAAVVAVEIPAVTAATPVTLAPPSSSTAVE